MLEYSGMGKMIVTVNGTEDLPGLKEAGADAVVMAVKGMSYSAMCPYSAEDTGELLSACEAQGLQLYLNMNALFRQGEVPQAARYLHMAAEAGVHGILFSDPMLLRAARQIGAEGRMIYHPMTLLTNSFDAAWWMEQGLLSAVVSPVLTASEITGIVRNVSGLTVQIHGRSLMSVSARSLLGAFREQTGCGPLAGRRDLYLTEEQRTALMPVFENERGTMIFTDFIHESFREILSFRDAGDCGFLIEGTGIPAGELADAVRSYRMILAGADPDDTAETYRKKYPGGSLSSGYYEQETIK